MNNSHSSASDQVVLVGNQNNALSTNDERYAIQTPSMQGPGLAGHREVKRAVFSVEELFSYVRKYGIVAAIVGLLLGVGLYTFVQTRTPVFESTSIVLLNQGNGKQLNLETIRPEEQSEYTLPQLVNNLKNEISSDKFRLSFFGAVDDHLRDRIIGVRSESEQGLDDQAIFLDRVSKQIAIEVLKDSHMVSVTAKSQDNQLAAELANAYVAHFCDYTRQEEMENTRKVADFLQSKASDLLVRVKQLEAELLAFREKEGISAGQADSEFAANQVNNLNTQLVEAKLNREKIAETLDIIDSAGKDPEDLLKVPLLAENAVLAEAYAELNEARSEVGTLSIDFGKMHPRMIVAVNKEQDALENLQKLVGQMVGSLQRQLKTSTSKVVSLETKVKVAKNELTLAGNKSVGQELKEEQLKSGRELYNSLIRQKNEADIALQFSGVDRVRITEQALPQRDPIFPRKPLSAVLGLVAFGGCFFGIPLTLGLGKRVIELAQPATTEEEAPAIEQTAEQVPAMAPNSHHALPSFPQSNQTSEALNYPTLVTFPRGDASQSRDWVRHASDPAVRSGVELNAYLTRLISEPNQARGLILTSNHYNPAKTLSAAALALAASRRGLRTLLVSSEKLTPSMSPEQTQYRDGALQKTADELLAPFHTEQQGLFFVTDDAWKRIPSLCLETLTNAHHCVDLLILDAPLVSAESELAILSGFASNIVLVRNSSEDYHHSEQQKRFQRILPACTVTGEFLIEG
ncbi:hypothetical protein JIN77_09375 [Verrucomicrobiaceae bacterium R5-34]|nr:hypothetical protein [Verrucomicrobiaceae bacterium R5-34]